MNDSRDRLLPDESTYRSDPAMELQRLWQQSSRPDVWRFLGEAGDLPASQVAAVLAVDQRQRWSEGERVYAEGYLEKCPALCEVPEIALELVYGEFLLREQLGEKPQLTEYAERFPQYADRLRQQIDLHEALQSDGAADVDHTLTGSPGPAPGAFAASNSIPMPRRLPPVAGYELERELGRGAMGVVYLAWQRSVGRHVALKMILPGLCAGRPEMTRFSTEAAAVGRLQHANVVQIYDVGQEDGQPFFSMEFVDGGALADQLTGVPWPVQKSAALIETLARAIQHAHERGIIHRDLKPGNVLLTASGTPKISDFGLAKLLTGGATQTRSGAILGTPSYMAPEQASGKAHVVGPAADVYALGAILYELLTGRPPFRAESPIETIEQVLNDEPLPPRRLQPKLPRDLETICLKCLDKSPSRRYPTAHALAEDLYRFLSCKPIRARPVSRPERLWRWCRRNPAVASLAGSVLVLLMVVAVVSAAAALWQARARTRAETAERRARHELAQSLLAQAAAIQRTEQPGQRLNSLELLRRAARELRGDPSQSHRLEEIRNHAIAALGLIDLRSTWERETGATMDVSFDHELARYALVELRSGDLVMRRRDDLADLLRIPNPGMDYWHAWSVFSPDGRYLAVSYVLRGEPQIVQQIWQLDRKELLFHERGTGSLAFHPDGRRVLYCPLAGGIAVHDLIERRDVRRLPLEFRLGGLCLDGQGKRAIVSASSDQPLQVRVVDLESGQALAEWTRDVGNSVMSCSDDGQLLAIGHDDGRVFVRHLGSGRLVSVLRGHTNTIIGVQFAPGKHLLATTSWDGTSRFWDVITGESHCVIPGAFLRFSSNGRQAAILASARVSVWTLAGGCECRTLHPGLAGPGAENTPKIPIRCAEFSPDSRLLALGGWDGVRIYESSTGVELSHLRSGSTDSVFFDADGASLLTSSRAGLYRWPIHKAPEQGSDALRIGPPQFLDDGPGSQEQTSWAAWRKGGSAVAILDNPNASVRLVKRTGKSPVDSRPVVLRRGNQRMTSVDTSPDGQWTAVGGWKERGIYVWHIPTRRLDRILVPSDGAGDTQTVVRFSPDGRWLVSCSHNNEAGGYYFWRVGTWERGLFVPFTGVSNWVPPAFTLDGQLMALSLSSQQVLLADAATGRHVAHISTLQQRGASPLAFSPDGTKLVVATNQKTVLLWDLALIRERLAAMELDWDLPAILPSSPQKNDSNSLLPQVQVVGAVPDLATRRKWENAALRLRLLLHPADAAVHYQSGLHHLKQGNRSRALDDFGRAIHFGGKDPDLFWQRGQIYLQSERWREAEVDLSRYLALVPDDGDAYWDRAAARTAQGRLREAVADYTEAIRFQGEVSNLYGARGTNRLRLQEYADAITDLKKAIQLAPEWTPGAHNNLAWIYIHAPAPFRNPENALPLAKRAVELAPSQWQCHRTLSKAYHRLGRWQEALAARELSIKLKGEAAGGDEFFCAVCLGRLGETARARICYDKGMRWQKAHPDPPPDESDDVGALRTEAADLLGIKRPS